MNLLQTFELTMTLDTEKYNKLMNKKNRMRTDEGIQLSDTLVSEGITVNYHNNQYKKKIKLKVTPKWILGSDDIDYHQLTRKLIEYITENFGTKYQLDDFRVTGMFLISDIDVRGREKAADYLKILQRIGRVKGFSPINDNWIGDDISFILKGNSNGIEFWAYDLEKLLIQQLDDTGSERKLMKSVIKKSEGLIRIEVHLTEMKAIRVYTDETDIIKQIKKLYQRGEQVFLDTFMRVIPLGDFYKKDEAVEMVWRMVEDKPIRYRMLRLLDLVPEKKSLHLAQKTLNYRKLDRVMEMFDDIQVSPITISKRHDVKRLDSLYKYL